MLFTFTISWFCKGQVRDIFLIVSLYAWHIRKGSISYCSILTKQESYVLFFSIKVNWEFGPYAIHTTFLKNSISISYPILLLGHIPILVRIIGACNDGEQHQPNIIMSMWCTVKVKYVSSVDCFVETLTESP